MVRSAVAREAILGESDDRLALALEGFVAGLVADLGRFSRQLGLIR